jgi:pyridoxal phosphate-dependent aminotransferase EpsN
MIPNFRVQKSIFNNAFIEDAIENGWGSGRNKYIDLCEKFLADYTGRKYAVMFNNATTAMLAGLSYFKGENTMFIAPNKTWIGTVTPAIRNNMDIGLVNTNKPFYISEEDFKEIKEFSSECKKKIIICNVDLMGFSANHESLQRLSNECGFAYVVDAAESLGTKVHGNSSAKYGMFSTISFNSTKIISGTGGGVLLTDNQDLASHVLGFRNNFQDKQLTGKFFWSYDVGTNGNLSNILAAFIYSQLLKLDDLLDNRKHLYEAYKQHLGDLVIKPNEYCESNNWHTCISLDNFKISKELIIELAQSLGLELRPGFYKISEQSVFDKIKNISIINPVNNSKSDYICLPAGDITNDEVLKIVEII